MKLGEHLALRRLPDERSMGQAIEELTNRLRDFDHSQWCRAVLRSIHRNAKNSHYIREDSAAIFRECYELFYGVAREQLLKISGGLRLTRCDSALADTISGLTSELCKDLLFICRPLDCPCRVQSGALPRIERNASELLDAVSRVKKKLEANPGCSLTSRLRDALSQRGEEMAGAKIVVKTEIPERYDDCVRIGIADLTSIIVNLFDNAIEAMRDRPVRNLTCHISPKSARVVLLISDTGRGISKRDQKRILVATPGAGERGFGLPRTKSLLRKCGGNLRFKSSNVNKGTVVQITLRNWKPYFPIRTQQEGANAETQTAYHR
jgi:hypothetical protein